LVAQPDGKILAGGSGWIPMGTNTETGQIAVRWGIIRYNPDGSFDDAFNRSGEGLNNMQVFSMALQQDGKILIGGVFGSYNSTVRQNLARLNPDGSLDADFLAAAGTNWISGGENDLGMITQVAVQPDGRILIGGYFTNVWGAVRRGVARLNSDGSLDPSFDPGDNIREQGEVVLALVIQPNGRIVVGGSFSFSAELYRPGLTRLNRDGSLDRSFIPTGPPLVGEGPLCVVLTPDGYLVTGQSQGSSNGTVKRLVGDPGWGPVLERRTIGNGPFEVGFYAQGGRRYQLQTSENLTSWVNWTTREGNNDVLWIPDPNSTTTAHRFYRALMDPLSP